MKESQQGGKAAVKERHRSACVPRPAVAAERNSKPGRTCMPELGTQTGRPRERRWKKNSSTGL